MSELIEPVTPDDGTEEASKSPGGKRLTRAQWLEIEDHVAYDTMSYRDISKTYGISSKGIRGHFARMMKGGVVISRGCKRHLLAGKIAAGVATTVAASTSGAVIGAFAAKRRERIEVTKTSLLAQSQAIQGLVNVVLKNIHDAASTTMSAATADENLKTLQRAAMINQSLINGRWTLLDIENDIDEATMPKLIIEDLTSDEISRMQSAGSGDDDDLDVDVTDDDAEESEIVEEGGDD